MSGLLHLYLGHLVGDFVLQNGYIAKNKERRFGVLIFHVLLVGLSHVLFLLPGINSSVMIVVGLIVVAHFFIDLLKVKLSLKYGWVKKVGYYLFDQLLHLITIIVASIYLQAGSFWISDSMVLLLILAVLDAYVFGILAYIGFGYKNSNYYSRDWIGYLFRGSSPFVHIIWWPLGVASLTVGVLVSWFLYAERRQEFLVSFVLAMVTNLIIINLMNQIFWR